MLLFSIHLPATFKTNETPVVCEWLPGSFLDSYPFSEKEMLVIGPEWPGKLATFALSFKSQILITLKFESYTNGKNDHHANIQATYSYVLHRITIALFGIEFVEILKYLSVVPVPKIKPSGWNWAHVSAKESKTNDFQ